jgi:hypothetical protein
MIYWRSQKRLHLLHIRSCAFFVSICVILLLFFYLSCMFIVNCVNHIVFWSCMSVGDGVGITAEEFAYCQQSWHKVAVDFPVLC